MDNNNMNNEAGNGKMREIPTLVWAYVGGLIGFFIAYFCGTRNENTIFHINQQLVYSIFMTGAAVLYCFCWIPFLGWLVALASTAFMVFLFVNWIMNMVRAFKGGQRAYPLIGGITIIKG